MVVTLGLLVIRVVLIVGGTMKSTIKERVNWSVSSVSLLSVMFIVKHPSELLFTVACTSLSS